MNNTGKFLTYEDFVTLHPDTMTVLQYNGLITAIPKKWLKFIQGTDKQDVGPRDLYEELNSKKKVVREVYKVMNDKKPKQFELKLKQINEKIPVTEQEYVSSLSSLYGITNITKYRDFQYRLLVNNIHTNVRLVHWKIVHSALCELCHEERQTVTHLFFDCPKIAEIWRKTQEYLQQKMNIDTNELQFTVRTIMLNIVHENRFHIANFIVLIVKQHIHACKCMQKRNCI